VLTRKRKSQPLTKVDEQPSSQVRAVTQENEALWKKYDQLEEQVTDKTNEMLFTEYSKSNRGFHPQSNATLPRSQMARIPAKRAQSQYGHCKPMNQAQTRQQLFSEM